MLVISRRNKEEGRRKREEGRGKRAVLSARLYS